MCNENSIRGETEKDDLVLEHRSVSKGQQNFFVSSGRHQSLLDLFASAGFWSYQKCLYLSKTIVLWQKFQKTVENLLEERVENNVLVGLPETKPIHLYRCRKIILLLQHRCKESHQLECSCIKQFFGIILHSQDEATKASGTFYMSVGSILSGCHGSSHVHQRMVLTGSASVSPHPSARKIKILIEDFWSQIY